MSETTKEQHHSHKEGEVESNENREEEEDEQERDDDEEVEDDEVTTTSAMGNFLPELNLIMIMTFLTLSDEDLLKMDESEKLAAAEERESKGKVSSVPKVHGRSKLRDCVGFKSADRRSVSKSQPRILDSRHGRKM